MVRSPFYLVALVLLLFVQGGLAQRYEWRDVVQNVTIGPSGDVVVNDTRTLWTDGDFGEAFICFELSGRHTIELLPGSGAISPGPPATAFSQPCPAGRELVVRNETRVSERRIRLVYRLGGTTDVFSDVVQWYWNLIQLDHPPIIGYSLTVTAPGPMALPFDAYVHRYFNAEEPVVTLSPDRSTLNVTFERIPPGSGVEIRYLMDPALFIAKSTTAGLQHLLEDEAKGALLDLHRGSPLGPVYLLNPEVVLPFGLTEDADPHCAVAALELAGGGLAICYVRTGNAVYSVADVEQAFISAGYKIRSRRAISPSVSRIEFEHPTWEHTIRLVLLHNPGGQNPGAIIVFRTGL